MKKRIVSLLLALCLLAVNPAVGGVLLIGGFCLP